VRARSPDPSARRRRSRSGPLRRCRPGPASRRTSQQGERQIEGVSGPENHGEAASLRLADDVLDEGAGSLGVRPPTLAVLALGLADSTEVSRIGAWRRRRRRCECRRSAALARLGNQGKGGQRVTRLTCGKLGSS